MRENVDKARHLARSLGIPVVCSWGAIDLLPADDPLMCGGFGTHGTRPANFAVQNADLLIVLGCRLDTKATGTPEHFARGAKIVMVDLDWNEIAKFDKLGRKIDVPIQADCGAFLDALDKAMPWKHSQWIHWQAQQVRWRQRYASKDDPAWTGVKPYAFMRELAQYTTPDDIIVSDTGCTLGWAMQGFPFKGERFVHAFNITPMGYGLGAAVGAAFATGRRVIALCGDGSIMMSLSELATIKRWTLPVKIIVFSNEGHAMCRQTQRQWFGGTYPATSFKGGLYFLDFKRVATAFGFQSVRGWRMLFNDDLPGLSVIDIDPMAQLIPQARYGAPIEDADPRLPREELRQQMMIPLLEMT